jgi:hypothetical protein
MNKPAKYHFFVDAQKYEVDKPSLTGAEIKQVAKDFNPAYQLYLEGHGNDADRPISDAEALSLSPAGGILKFYSVPPATFGRL